MYACTYGKRLLLSDIVPGSVTHDAEGQRNHRDNYYSL